MTTERTREHDWQSHEYVNEWISKDVTKDEQRRPLLRQMLSFAPFEKTAPLRVLDIGGGYGLVSEEVLKFFPKARVTLHDYSLPMIVQAKSRLAAYADRTTFAQADMTKPGWTDALAGPYDLAVSAIAIHNLRNAGQIAQVYTDVFKTLDPKGAFLDADYPHGHGLDAHLAWLRQAGFAHVECPQWDGHLAVMVARVS